MVHTERIDSIVFDLKQSVEDLGNELKLMLEEIEALNKKLRLLERNTA